VPLCILLWENASHIYVKKNFTYDSFVRLFYDKVSWTLWLIKEQQTKWSQLSALLVVTVVWMGHMYSRVVRCAPALPTCLCCVSMSFDSLFSVGCPFDSPIANICNEGCNEVICVTGCSYSIAHLSLGNLFKKKKQELASYSSNSYYFSFLLMKHLHVHKKKVLIYILANSP